ncbi:MAG: VWA domain-containing protein [Xanthobacteraceae bacterium]|nr:VWA domain-containing protein [Xanthobacteraceae bacterium]
MAYSAEISRENPTCVLFVVDQSTSMGHLISERTSKAGFVADVLNKTIQTIAVHCTKSDGVRDYFEIGVVAYSGTTARYDLPGMLAERGICPISAVAANPLRVESRKQQISDAADRPTVADVKFPVWFEKRSKGSTSMCAGLNLALRAIQDWCESHRKSYPPTILHITDGHPTDGDPEPISKALMSIGTTDGTALLFNLHVDVGGEGPIYYPSNQTGLKDRYAQRLFRMSSDLNEKQLAILKSRGRQVAPGAKGFIFNGGLEAVADFFDIGTRPALAANR